MNDARPPPLRAPVRPGRLARGPGLLSPPHPRRRPARRGRGQEGRPPADRRRRQGLRPHRLPRLERAQGPQVRHARIPPGRRVRGRRDAEGRPPAGRRQRHLVPGSPVQELDGLRAAPPPRDRRAAASRLFRRPGPRLHAGRRHGLGRRPRRARLRRLRRRRREGRLGRLRRARRQGQDRPAPAGPSRLPRRRGQGGLDLREQSEDRGREGRRRAHRDGPLDPRRAPPAGRPAPAPGLPPRRPGAGGLRRPAGRPRFPQRRLLRRRQELARPRQQDAPPEQALHRRRRRRGRDGGPFRLRRADGPERRRHLAGERSQAQGRGHRHGRPPRPPRRRPGRLGLPRRGRQRHVGGGHSGNGPGPPGRRLQAGPDHRLRRLGRRGDGAPGFALVHRTPRGPPRQDRPLHEHRHGRDGRQRPPRRRHDRVRRALRDRQEGPRPGDDRQAQAPAELPRLRPHLVLGQERPGHQPAHGRGPDREARRRAPRVPHAGRRAGHASTPSACARPASITATSSGTWRRPGRTCSTPSSGRSSSTATPWSSTCTATRSAGPWPART